ncbi:MAG: Gfo/Idh/MocA family oxidoreductase [Bryobacterales bacterium]|nr:Gfo/Idh/MocA family oxidoreductase [Bryobacterales bacterium]
MPTKLRVALIGHGFMGRAHSNAFAQVGRFFDLPYQLERAVLCGRNREPLQAMASRWGWRETATDWRALVDRDDIDLVDIATPNATHAEMAIALARAGKIVLCEKPMAISREQGSEMVEAARNVPTMVWFNYRRVPAVAYARQLIDEGRIGPVYHYRAVYLQDWPALGATTKTWKLSKAGAGSGVLGDLLSHIVDLALYLNGDISEVSAMMHTFAPGREIDDATMAMARFANGSVGSFEATRYAVGCRNRNQFEIHGQLGMLRFDLEDMARLEYFDATAPPRLQGTRKIMVTGPNQPYANNYWKPGHVIGYEHTFIGALGDFLQALAAGSEFHPGFADAQKVQVVLDAIERSAGSRSWVAVE